LIEGVVPNQFESCRARFSTNFFRESQLSKVSSVLGTSAGTLRVCEDAAESHRNPNNP
jgi:hypothetical protein